MTELERKAAQAILAYEAIAKLHGISALFGVEEGYRGTDADRGAFNEWHEAVARFEDYLWNKSPLA